MITSVIEGVVHWLVFPHQIFCHDLILSDSNQWDWLSNKKALFFSVISEQNLGRLERILPLGVIEVPGLGKRRPLLDPLKPRHLSEIFAPFSVITWLHLDLKLRFKWQPSLLCGTSNRSTMKGRELWEELRDDDERGLGPPDLNNLNLYLARSHPMVNWIRWQQLKEWCFTSWSPLWIASNTRSATQAAL